jgi:6-phosphogluconate dehydrogenase (decarboxylating)
MDAAVARNTGIFLKGVKQMQIGMIGLGKMGGNMSRRLMKAGHQCVVFDANAKPGAALAKTAPMRQRRLRIW